MCRPRLAILFLAAAVVVAAGASPNVKVRTPEGTYDAPGDLADDGIPTSSRGRSLLQYVSCSSTSSNNKLCQVVGTTTENGYCCQGKCVVPSTNYDSTSCSACGQPCPEGFKCCRSQCYNLLVGSTTFTPADGLVHNCGSCDQTCPASTTCCSGTCTGTTDSNNCGGCGRKCQSGQLCLDGTSCVDVSANVNHCGALATVCTGPDAACCHGLCTGLASDPENCGVCGKACGPDQHCCGGTCKSIITDSSNCGACGNVCPAGSTCCDGKCATLSQDEGNCGTCGKQCDEGFKCCGGTCKAVQSDSANCGTCGNSCPAGTTVRRLPPLRPAASPAQCCGGSCVNTAFDESHCSACFKGCDSGLACCGGSCVNTLTSTATCGNCGTACTGDSFCCLGQCINRASNFDAQSCGACGKQCPLGFECCGGQCVDVTTDRRNCGKCGSQCTQSGYTCCSGHCKTRQSIAQCRANPDGCFTKPECCCLDCASLTQPCLANEDCCLANTLSGSTFSLQSAVCVPSGPGGSGVCQCAGGAAKLQTSLTGELYCLA